MIDSELSPKLSVKTLLTSSSNLLCLSVLFFSTFLKKPMDHKDVKECMPFMWTALFIYLNLPAPDSLINFAMRWSIVDSIPEIIVEKCKVPQAVIAKWTEKCAPLPKRKQTKETTQ